jgi:hypothetical protein
MIRPSRFPNPLIYRSSKLPLARLLLFLFILLISSFLRGDRVARAENLGPGGGTRIIVGDEIVGPYQLLVTASPEPAYPGTLTFLVRISDPATDGKVLDADVVVELVHSEDGERLTGKATHTDANNAIDYVAHIPVERTGAYDGVIRIKGPAGEAEITFIQQVVAKRGLSGIIIAGLPFLVVLALLGGIWFARSGHRPAPS